MAGARRIEVLLERAQFERLAAQSIAEGRSMSALVREAIHASWAESDNRRRVAGDVILSAERMPVPDDLRRELDEMRAGRSC